MSANVSLDQLVTQKTMEIARLKQWIDDLQSGLYVNCVYCGHRYGPGETTPVSMADALKRHVAQCSAHPMSRLLSALKTGHQLVEASCTHVTHGPSKADAQAWLAEAQAAIDFAEGRA